MPDILNEKVVMQYYIDELDKGNIDFLRDRQAMADAIRKDIAELIAAVKMNDKIGVATKLWKKLFEASMTHIDANKQGYDKLFSFFDTYVEFEELIFASDSFYRDHTLHCLWVYFLGEYVARRAEFAELFNDSKAMYTTLSALNSFLEIDELKNEPSLQGMRKVCKLGEQFDSYDAASRCVSALTHDLGYPIKKIDKINKSIKSVLPFFSLHSFEDFKFEYSDVQQHFIESFLEFLSSDSEINLNLKHEIATKIFDVDEKSMVTGVKPDAIKSLTHEELMVLKENTKGEITFDKKYSLLLDYSNDFEEYKHGIMSAFLLVKTLQAFKNMNYIVGKNLSEQSVNLGDFYIKMQILQSITNHTCDAYKITQLDSISYLTIIDELEEFSRISRASQSREYVQEFCSTKIYMDDGWLCVDFIFDNDELDNLNPEIAFKGRCKKMLTLFSIKDMSPKLKLRIRCIAKLERDKRTYALIIARKRAEVLIDGEMQNIPKYLKSNQFYTSEEYAKI